MNNTKTTKRALLTSVMAMLLCVTMLIGTTYAWFTDSASTGVNKIQAGTLDVGLEMKTGTDAEGNSVWANAEGETLGWVAADGRAQDQIFWEPGCTYTLPTLKITNKGNLALQFKILITNISGDLELLNALEFPCTYASCDETWTSTPVTVQGSDIVNLPYELPGDPDDVPSEDLIVEYGIKGSVLPYSGYIEGYDANVAYYTIEAHMKESAGNEYQGLALSDIAITIVATQIAGFESDSFDDLYDKDAQYPVMDSATLNTALRNGGSIVLGTDVKAENYMDISNDTTIGLDGNTLTIGDNTKLVNGSDLTVSGGTVLRETYSGYVDVRPGTTTDSVITYTDVVFDNTYKTRTNGPCTDRVKSALEFCPENGGSATFYFKNCTFNNAQVLFEGLSGTTGSFTATFENCTFNNLGTSAGIEVANYLTGTVTIKDCIFNLTATATMNAIKSSNSVVTWNFEGTNTVNGSAATASGVDGTVDQIKVMNPSVKVYSINTTNGTVVNGLDTVTVTGIATK